MNPEIVPMISAKDARELLGGISKATLWNYVQNGALPQPPRRGWYLLSDILDFMYGGRKKFEVGVQKLIALNPKARALQGLKPGSNQCMRILRQLGVPLARVYSLGETVMAVGAVNDADDTAA